MRRIFVERMYYNSFQTCLYHSKMNAKYNKRGGKKQADNVKMELTEERISAGKIIILFK